MVIGLIVLIPLAIIYILSFPLGALLCRYVPIELTAVVNITLGILVFIFMMFVTLDIFFYDEIFFTFVPVYIYIPNLILYFKMRSLYRRRGAEKAKYDINNNFRLTAFLTVCYFPSIFIPFIFLMLLRT